jgi:UDP-glucose 4-epimerase
MSSVVLVTGGAGFIGSHVVDGLAAAGYIPRILDVRASPWHGAGEIETVIGDVRRVDDVVDALRGCSAVCHLAAAADVGEVHAEPGWATELNAMGTLNVLEAARVTGVRRVLYASTVWVYSDVDAPEADEETLLPSPAHVYTAGKLSGELYCRSYAELYGLETTVLRFGIPYGPRARPAAVIPSFVDRARSGKPITIAGTGEQERSFVYVEDLARGVVKALAPGAAGGTYNLAGDETVTIRELAEIVKDEVAEAEILHTEGRAGDLRGASICSRRADEELGWRATTPLREGVRSYAAWLDQQALAPASEPEPLPVVEDSGLRRLLSRLAGVGSDPMYVGAAGLIAVASAVISVILGMRDIGKAADFTLTGIALMFPIWVLATTTWPPAYRRMQAAAAGLVATISVVAIGLLSAGDGGGGDMRLSWVFVLVVLSACLTHALRVLPSRLAPDST